MPNCSFIFTKLSESSACLACSAALPWRSRGGSNLSLLAHEAAIISVVWSRAWSRKGRRLPTSSWVVSGGYRKREQEVRARSSDGNSQTKGFRQGRKRGEEQKSEEQKTR